MSKRKNRSSSPNVPQETLERARQQLAGANPDKPAEPAPEAPVEVKAEAAAPAARPVSTTAARSRSAASRRRLEGAQARAGRKDQMDAELIKERLQNPTRVVTEDQLRAEYGFVMRDLRTIAIISAAMIALMIVLAQFI